MFTSVRILDTGSSGEKLEAGGAEGGGRGRGWDGGKRAHKRRRRVDAHPLPFCNSCVGVKSLCKLVSRLCRYERCCMAVVAERQFKDG